MRYLLSYRLFEGQAASEISDAAWLYFLVYVYEDGLPIDSWEDDMRMGGIMSESFERLKKMGFAKREGDKFVVDNSEDARQYVMDTFTRGKIPKTIDEARSMANDLKKYDTVTYHISRIPFDIREREFSNLTDIKYTLDNSTYRDILKWIKTYQRSGNTINNRLVKYAGAADDLFPSDLPGQTIYRGIYLTNDQFEKMNIKEGDTITDSRLSWTKDYEMARRFAEGNTNWMDNKKLDDHHVGVVLSNEFDKGDIFLDLEWVDEHHKYFQGEIDFPDEAEIVVLPRKRNVRVYKVF